MKYYGQKNIVHYIPITWSTTGKKYIIHYIPIT